MDFGPSGFYGADRICAGWPEGGALFVAVFWWNSRRCLRGSRPSSKPADGAILVLESKQI